jgi:uncharacterized protein YidB (DUF937 family)
MEILEAILGGTVAAALVTAANELLAKHGGVSGLVAKFQEKGFGPIVQSWVSTGENKPIEPEQISQAVGPDFIGELAAKAGMTPEELKKKLAEILPTAVDKLTPEGKVP